MNEPEQLALFDLTPNLRMSKLGLEFDDLGRYIDTHDYVWEGE